MSPREHCNPTRRVACTTTSMSAISPPPIGADAEENVQNDNRTALVALQKDSVLPKRGSLAAMIGSALAVGLAAAVIATLGARRARFRRPWYFRLISN